MSHRVITSLLIAAIGCWTSACWDSPGDTDGSIGGPGTSPRAPLTRPVLEPDDADESAKEVLVEQDVPIAAPDEDPAETIRRLDSALAADEEETVLDLMLDLEDQGGAAAVNGLGLVIDRALDDELKLDAIASLSMLAEEEDVSAPLLRALDDDSPSVRVEALDVMADGGMVNLLPVLRLRMQRASDPETREALEETIEELEYTQKLGRP